MDAAEDREQDLHDLKMAREAAKREQVAALRAALRNMADAYERKVRTGLTPEDIAKQPWRCAEYIEAERVLKMPLHFTREWLMEKIKTDLDLPCEAGPAT